MGMVSSFSEKLGTVVVFSFLVLFSSLESYLSIIWSLKISAEGIGKCALVCFSGR